MRISGYFALLAFLVGCRTDDGKKPIDYRLPPTVTKVFTPPTAPVERVVQVRLEGEPIPVDRATRVTVHVDTKGLIYVPLLCDPPAGDPGVERPPVEVDVTNCRDAIRIVDGRTGLPLATSLLFTTVNDPFEEFESAAGRVDEGESFKFEAGSQAFEDLVASLKYGQLQIVIEPSGRDGYSITAVRFDFELIAPDR